jgi:predicted nucleic acid-binding protein
MRRRKRAALSIPFCAAMLLDSNILIYASETEGAFLSAWVEDFSHIADLEIINPFLRTKTP